MMGVPLPSIGELIMENKRLSMIGDGLCLFLSALSCSYTCSSLSPFLLTFPPLTCATCLGNPAVERVRRAGDKAKGGKKKTKAKARRKRSGKRCVFSWQYSPLLVCPFSPTTPSSLSLSLPRAVPCAALPPQPCDRALSVIAARDRADSRSKKCRQRRDSSRKCSAWGRARGQHRCARAAPPGDGGKDHR